MSENQTDILGRQITKEKLVENLDLLRAVVEKKVKLKFGDYGLCPFHDEKTRSFHIFKGRDNRARYHCFGCGAGGDVLEFVKLTEDCTFPQALHKLSEWANVEILETNSANSTSFCSPGPRDMTQAQTNESDRPFCERDCPTYANLREDYYIVLEENRHLREQFGLGEFRPSNETRG